MASNQAYYITESGTWPNEVYKIALSGQLINPALGSIPADNSFRFVNNQTVPLNGLPSNYGKYEYLNSIASFDTQGLIGLDTFANTVLVWNVSAERRAFNVGNTLNSLSMDIAPGKQVSERYYSYLLYPKRLFLKPTAKPTKVGNNWVLNTQTVLLNTNTTYYLGSSIDLDAANGNITFLKNRPTTTSLISDSNYSIVYNLCASRTRVGLPLISFTDSYNPSYYSTVLEPAPVNSISKSRIRPDTTYITYNVNYYAADLTGKYSLYSLGQQRGDENLGLSPTLKSSYIITTGMPTDKQAFQLVQIKNDNSNSDLGNSKYCVLSGVFDLSNSNFSYYNNNYLKTSTSITNAVTGNTDTSISVSYIADCPALQFSNEFWQDTVISTGTPLGIPLVTTSPTHNSINWTTKYPPHYYSYKASLTGLSSEPLMETANLTFYLKCSSISEKYTSGKNYTSSVTLSSFIASDFNFISYDLWSGASSDYIKFSPLVPSNTVFLSSLYCYYGNNLNIPYSLVDTPWIAASSANSFLITYPRTTHGELDFSLRPSLCTLAGYVDAYDATRIQLAIGQLPYNEGQPIFLSKIYETEDYMEVDGSFLNSASSWPTRDLTDSYISWFFTPTNNFVTINSVDYDGNFIQSIPPFSAVPFGYNTWTVVVSGYGPQTTVINLSSQKYNEVTTLSSNSALFNYFVEEKLLVGAPYGINNLNETRTVYLTCAVPYKGRQYNLPNNTQINWIWSYNDDIDYETIPVDAYLYPSLSSYTYGYDLDTTELSSIKIEVTPPYTNSKPNINTVRAIASIDSQSGLIEGTYTFEVDDFPDPSIFNADFSGYYTSFKNVSAEISNTRNKKYIITRPNNGTNNYTFSSLGDVIPTYIDDTIVWNVSSNNNVNTYTYGNNPITVNVSNVSKTIVSLSALNAIVPGWTSAHNVQSTTVVNILDSSEFNKSLQFLTIPEFFWKNGKYLTLSNQNNYTSIPSNTAYANKTSNSQGYYLSANKSYLNDFRYYTGDNLNTKLQEVFSYYQLVDVPYSSEMYVSSGLRLSLTAFNDQLYPENNGLYYKMPSGSILNTYVFNITAKSDNNSTNKLQKNLKLIPYTDITTSYVVDTTAIDIDNDRVITIYQNISTSIPESPVELVDGTITYTLSSYFWSVNKDVPVITGSYDLFELIIGDPVNELTVSGNRKNTLFLSASSNINKKIFPSTFKNYSDNDYTGSRNLWNTITQKTTSISPTKTLVSSSTAANPEIFISTAYVLTGENLFVQFDTPESIKNVSVIAYMINFGENDSDRITAFDSTLFYSYKNSGTFYISYSALYSDGSLRMYEHPNPIFVKNNWQVYDPNALRFVEETILTLPYTNEEVFIQPNEWGDSDIFNTSIGRIQDNLDYLASNLQTINTNSPTILFGWLGSNPFNLSDGIRWYSRDFGSEFYLNPEIAVSSGTSYFNQIRDGIEINNRIYVLDENLFKCLSGNNFSSEISLEGSDSLNSIFLKPISLEVDETGNIVFIADPPKNKVYRFDLEFNTQSTLNYTLNVGGLGSKKDNNKFNSPSELAYENQHLYVLDFNNRCVKEYNSDLNWVHTYEADEFLTEKPTNIAVHPEFQFLYVLTETKTIYIFNPLGTTYFSKFKLSNINSNIIKIIFDEVGDFIYAVTATEVYKYSASGYFISQLDLPTNLVFVGAKKATNRSILLLTEKCIIKLQDILEVHKVGEGLPSQYWSKEQLLMDRDELSSDTNYNRCLVRIAQNIKTFRSSLNYKLVLATEQTSTNVVKYFTSIPINFNDLPSFDGTIETESLGVGVNELHTPQVVNRELFKLCNALNALKSFLDITDYNLQSNDSNNGCNNIFCWSWKAMSCYKLTFPAIRICNINPITYAELENSFPVSYAPTKTWNLATSECCNKVIPPV
jgi:hypothetical protein